MPNRDWEIQKIEAGTRSRFHIEGFNHCTLDPLFQEFSWGVDEVKDPRYFAAADLVVSEKVQSLLDRFGQIGSGL